VIEFGTYNLQGIKENVMIFNLQLNVKTLQRYFVISKIYDQGAINDYCYSPFMSQSMDGLGVKVTDIGYCYRVLYKEKY
jgi:hypothetical protein